MDAFFAEVELLERPAAACSSSRRTGSHDGCGRPGHRRGAVSATVRMADYSTLTRRRRLDAPTDVARGVRVEGPVPIAGAPRQEILDEWAGSDWGGAEGAADGIRARYGAAALRAGTLVTPRASLVRAPATATAIRDLS